MRTKRKKPALTKAERNRLYRAKKRIVHRKPETPEEASARANRERREAGLPWA